MPLSFGQHVRPHLRSCRRLVKETYAGVLRRLRKQGTDWDKALHTDELSFWEQALTDPEGKWLASEFNERTNSTLELQPYLQELIPAPVGARVRILDVGAGPLTRLGKQWKGRSLEIVPLDPLAEQYDKLLDGRHIVPPVRTIYGLAENLTSLFPESSFDLAYASNSLDHSRNPVQAIEQMVQVVKPGAYVYLWHFANVGVVELYGGLHQWNFDIVNDEFVISDGRERLCLREAISGVESITCEIKREFDNRVVVAKIRKRYQ